MKVQSTQSLHLQAPLKRLKQPEHLPVPCGMLETRTLGATAPDGFVNKNIMKSEPANVSFSGSFRSVEAIKNLADNNVVTGDGYKLAFQTEALDGLIKKAENLFKGENKSQSKVDSEVKKFTSSVIDYLDNPNAEVDAKVKSFAEDSENKSVFETVKTNLNKIFKDSKETDATKLKNLKQGSVKDAIAILQTEKNPGFIFKNRKLFKGLEMASDSQIVFSMLYALGLTCFLRPATIVALPGQKKNKDDKKYAAAHSIASGVIGYVISLAVSSPIATAIKKIGKNPKIYLDNDKAKYLGDMESKSFRSEKAFNRAKKLVNMVPETILAVPKAVVTIAMIPVILKYVFHMEKKPSKKTEVQAVQPQPQTETAKPEKINLVSLKGGSN